MSLPLVTRVHETDKKAISNLKTRGWYEVETLERWAISFTGPKLCADPRVAMAAASDIDRCVQIAEKSFVCDRLHRDPSVKRADADAFKVKIVKDGFEDEESDVFIYYDSPGPLSGFLICRKNDTMVHIILIAVDPAMQKRGIGTSLISHAIWYYTSQKPFIYDGMDAGTQSINDPAKKMYARLGFTLRDKRLTFHSWP